MVGDRTKKVPMPKQDPKVRIKNFEEVALGYSKKQAVEEAQRCLQCKKKPCIAGCPVEIDIPTFIGHIAEGDFDRAIAVIKEKNNLPAICGRVCPQETQCEEVCTLGKKGEPSAIGRLERFAADYEYATKTEREIWAEAAKVRELNDRRLNCDFKVAVVGSGPAGLTTAGDLARLGYEVTIFESLHAPGGVLRYGIPEFRLPKRILDREINYVKSLGVEIVTNILIGKTITIEELLKDGWGAVFIGTGAGLPNFMRIPGENLNGVYSANEFLTRVNLMKAYLFPDYDTPVVIGRRVAVVGAGNVAMDSARCALRLGAEEVSIVYRRSEEEMPAREEEVLNAKEEGIQFRLLTNPTRIFGDEKGWVKQMECIRMELGEPDASGRRRPIPIPGSEFILDVDIIVMAIGQSPNPLVPQATPGLKVAKHGNLIVDEVTGLTSLEGVYAGGDIATGAATVIAAMGAGKRSARAIAEHLKSKT